MRTMKYVLKGVALTCIAAAGLTACSSSEDIDDSPKNTVLDEAGHEGVKSEFVISIPRTVINTTRMTGNVVQNAGRASQFRGMDNIRLIPFSGEPTTTSAKLSNILRLSSITALSQPGTLNYKVYADQFVPIGTRNFLFYGKAIDKMAETSITSMDDLFTYGVLDTKGLEDDEFRTPNDITFSLRLINTNPNAQADNATGNNIIALLNRIANATASASEAPNDKWSTASTQKMQALYKNFIGITTASSNSVASVLSMLYFSLAGIDEADPTYPLAASIMQGIRGACQATPVAGQPLELSEEYLNYPQNIGLPVGAARIRWNHAAKAFVDVTANYGANLKVDLTHYTYPAALWYGVSTPLKASIEKESDKYDNETAWANVISNVYSTAQDEVQDNTQSVALKEPAQYGVGRMETAIKMGTGDFYDGNGKKVNLGTGFELTGLLIGGQNSVGFDFASKGNENLTIFDRNVMPNIIAQAGNTTAVNHTLALESKSDQAVSVALELKNGGDAFMGADGMIPAGGTFYMAALMRPQDASNYASGTLDKIFMQDHVSKVTITIHNGSEFPDRNDDGIPDVYVKDEDGVPTGVDTDGDGQPDPYDIDGDGEPDDFITDPEHGGPGWDTDGDGEVDRPVTPDTETGEYPDQPNVPEGLGNATNGVPDLSSPSIEIGTSVDLEWQEGLILNPGI